MDDFEYTDDADYGESRFMFSPELWEQRNERIREFLVAKNVREVCELGCGNGRLIKEITQLRHVGKIVGVDSHLGNLRTAALACTPEIQDYYITRKYHLQVSLVLADILKPSGVIPRQIECVICSQV